MPARHKVHGASQPYPLPASAVPQALLRAEHVLLTRSTWLALGPKVKELQHQHLYHHKTASFATLSPPGIH